MGLAGPRRERKIVTVLFADLVGFTARAEQMDPEDVADELSRYQQRLRIELERYGGTVEKFIGDAVMAIFGAPVAHEDDPERAVRAALAICGWAAEGDLQVRIGISTGEALVTLDARPEAGETMAAGDVVNTAARLQTAAPVNGVLVGKQTYRATVAVIEYGSAPPVTAKGKTEPVEVWRPVAARSRVTVERVHGADLVGRRRELELLVGALDRARAEREPQLVTLVGVPGIGKSRLVFELFERIEQEPNFTSWRQGRCLPYGDGITFWALGEMVKAQASILDGDNADVAAAKLRAAVDDAWVESHLRPLVGLTGNAPSEGGDRRDEAFAAWRRFFEQLAEQRPLVLVFEDLHWADDNLLDFVDHLVEWSGAVPLLVVCTARPELLTRRPDWGGGKANAVTISLSPLTDEEMARLVSMLLDRRLMQAPMQADLLARAGGNPLYAEEFARVLLERGHIAELPETVHGVIAARLDLLAADQKALLRDAAVVGTRFWVGAIRAMGNLDVDERLHALQRKEFIRRERAPSVVDELEYSFRHLLVRDVAYAQIPRADRVEKHRQVAQWIEGLGRPEDHAEMLAHHYLVALELAASAGLDASSYAQDALTALSLAGDRAMTLNAADAAARYYRAAVELVPAGEPGRGSLLVRLGRALMAASGTGVDALEAARQEFVDTGNDEGAADAETDLAEAYWLSGDRDGCFQHLDRALALVRDLPASRVKARTLVDASRFWMLAADDEAAVLSGRQALEMAERLGFDEIRAAALNNIGSARCNIGDNGGMADLRAAIEVAEGCGDVFEECRAKGNLAAMLWIDGDLTSALRVWQDAGAVADDRGQIGFVRWYRGIQTNAFTTGDWDHALERANVLIAEVEGGSPHYLATQAYATRALVRLGRDQAAAAMDDATNGVRGGRRAGDPQALCKALAAAGFVFAQTGREAEAAAMVEEFETEAQTHRSLGAAVFDSVFAALTMSLLRLDRGQCERFAATLTGSRSPWAEVAAAIALGDLASAAGRCIDMGARTPAAYIQLAAAHAGDSSGLNEALVLFRHVHATRHIREVQELMAAPA